MTYTLEITQEAEIHLQVWRKSGSQKDLNKIYTFFKELTEHPKTGTGHPEPLKGNRQGQWSRKINKKDRLIYTIVDETVTVTVISALGHYQDK